MKNDDYQLLDSGSGRKWERFGDFILNRPCPQAVWRPKGNAEAHATFNREEGTKWTFQRKLPASWEIEIERVKMKIAPTDFGHLGIFPEHASLWNWMQERLSAETKVLNLFAYSGGATLAALQKGASVCHLDASKGMVDWARENAKLNNLGAAPVRWIVDDAIKFLRREVKRQSRYDAILLDPPTFGRGSKGEVFKIERDIQPLLELCRELLSDKPRFLIFSCHTPGFTPIVLKHLLGQFFDAPIDASEMLLESVEAYSIPSGCVAKVEF
jgi:23S rRNA (cytosine1962-C5)-methyltransferase